jgi:GTP cyclohydrolase I
MSSVDKSMSVRALEPIRALHDRDGRPDRAEVEAAVRFIIRWTGDNPERNCLTETPARVVRSLEESFVGFDRDQLQSCRRASTKSKAMTR